MKYAFLPLIFALLSCGEHSLLDIFEDAEDPKEPGETIGPNELRTGWLASEENLETIPQDIMMSFSGNTAAAPPSYNIENKYPPIGDQGQYGTCAAWAVGYGVKTALDGMDNNWSSADLAKSANQTSPRDLWMAIPYASKGEDCGGTSFEAAFDALISMGASSLSESPYSGMNCAGTPRGNTGNKLANYRKIAYNESLEGGSGKSGMDVENFKNYISQGKPIAIGAKLGDRFMRWNNNSTISSDTYDNPGMQHAMHAMTLSGYDDNKQAFRVRNSWGSGWGDNGSIWVDYDFFLNKFCFAAFVAQNPVPSEFVPPPPEGAEPSYDLLASYAADSWNPESSNPRDRIFSYEVFNNGPSPVLAKQRWSIVYMYYNAYNAKEYEIIYEDEYTDQYGAKGKYGKLEITAALAGATWNNFDVQPGKRASEEEFPEGFIIEYTMPEITGNYYLVIYADAYEDIKETNENNNFYFITAANGKPMKFTNGVLESTIAMSNVLGKKMSNPKPAHSVAELGELNGYTQQEIKFLLKQSKKNGTLAKKIAQYRENSNGVKKGEKRSR